MTRRRSTMQPASASERSLIGRGLAERTLPRSTALPERDVFDPAGWTPRVPTAAILRARDDDTFWAARRVMAFSDEMIRALVKTGQYSEPQAEALLAKVLIQRRDKIGHAYVPAVNPVVNVALSETGMLTFANAAVLGRRRASSGWRIRHAVGSIRQQYRRHDGSAWNVDVDRSRTIAGTRGTALRAGGPTSKWRSARYS